MGLSDVGRTLPPGFRFYPSDEELIGHYLYKKIANEEAVRGTLVEIDLHTCEPWQLPEVAKLNSDEWYFFSFRDRKYATGYRTNRATTTGYWKATGKDRAVLDPSGRAVVGMRKTLVFYKNRAPNGMKTGWIMHEFRLENPHLPPKEDWVLCRVFNKWRGENGNKSSPQNLHDSKGGATATSPHLSMFTSENVCLLPNTCQNNIHHQGQNPRTSLSSSAVLDLDPAEGYFPDLCHDNDDDRKNVGPRGPSITSHHDQISKLVDQTKCEDDYGLLFDGIFDYSIDGEPSNLDDMRFVEDGNNSLVFL